MPRRAASSSASRSAMDVPRTQPGTTALTVTPYGPRSWAADRTSPSRPAFEALYAAMAGAPTSAAVDPIITILPHRASIMSAAARRVSSNAASRFRANVARHILEVSCQIGRLR